MQENQVSGILTFMAESGEIVGKRGGWTEQEAGFAHLMDGRQGPDAKMEGLEERRDVLASRLRAGNRAAAAELVDLYYEQIYLYMRRLGHSRAVSEDLTQESFLRAWQHIGQLRNGKALNSWLYRIAGNVSRLYWRRNKDKNAVAIEVADLSGSSDGKIGDFEQFEKLRDAIDGLSAKLKQAVVLHYLQHLTIAEAAEAAGIREGTFKSRLNRALRALREQVK